MTSFTLRARWVLPVDVPPLSGGYVSVHAGRIAAVGARATGSGPVEDLGDTILLPGLVNAHTHLEFSDLAAPLGRPGVSLPDWIRLVIADRKRSGRDPASALAAGLEESLRAGVTTLGEIATLPGEFYRQVNPRPATVLFQEAIGFSTARASSVAEAVAKRFQSAGGPAGFSPHAPYSAHPRLVERLVQLAVDRQAPIAMHLAESREELEFLVSGGGSFRWLLEERSMWDALAVPAGSRPLDYLQMLSRAPRALVIHGNYLSTEEIDFVAGRRESMSVVFCPRTHAYFGNAEYTLERMLATGARVVLGTDSRASNPDLNLQAEMVEVARRFPALEPERILSMATLEGATALGLAAETGSITVGKRADLLAISDDRASADPFEAFVRRQHDPLHLWIEGVCQTNR